MRKIRGYGLNIFAAGLLVCLLLSAFFLPDREQTSRPAFSFTTADKVTIQVLALYDQNLVLQGYRSHVLSPVCGGKECYPVELEFYWDVLGNFQKFELFPGKALTKQDHKAFVASDYEQLSKLLRNKSPVFTGLDRKDLVRQVSSDTIDGYTGATLESIKDEVIPGAVYSCYTLWHIANGAVKDSILSHSGRQLSDGLVRRISDPQNTAAVLFLVRNFSDRDFENYSGEVLRFISLGSGYTPSEVIKELPGGLLGNSSFQDSLAVLYPGLDYYARKSLLQALGNKLCSENLGRELINSMDHRSSQNTELIIGIFCKMESRSGDALYPLFLDRLLSKNVSLDKGSYRCIASRARILKLPEQKVRRLKQNIR